MSNIQKEVEEIMNDDLFDKLSKETHRIVEELTKDLIYTYRISTNWDSIISEWSQGWQYQMKFYHQELEKRGEHPVMIESPYTVVSVDAGLFNFTASVIQKVLSLPQLDSLINKYFEIEITSDSEVTLKNGDIIYGWELWLRELGFTIFHSTIEKYMDKANSRYDKCFKSTTLKYERRCGFDDGSKDVYIGLLPANSGTHSIYGYIGYIIRYLFYNPLIKYWGAMFRDLQEMEKK